MARFSDLLPDKQRVIYNEVLALKGQGLGYKRIIKRVQKEHDVGLALGTLSYWFNNDIKLLGGENCFELKQCPELSYALGVLFGDGCLSINQSKQEYRLRLESIDKEFVEKFSASLSELLGKEKNYAVCKTKRGMYSTQVRSKQLYHFVKSIKQDFEKVKPFIEKHPAEFIRGLADSEGCTSISAGKLFRVGVIVAVSTNFTLLAYVKELLYSFGIKSNLYLSHKKGLTDSIINERKITRTKNLYSLTIARSNDVVKFCEKIGFSIMRKQQKLEEAIRVAGEFGSALGTEEWKQRYFKKGKRWVRSRGRSSLPTDQNALAGISARPKA